MEPRQGAEDVTTVMPLILEPRHSEDMSDMTTVGPLILEPREDLGEFTTEIVLDVEPRIEIDQFEMDEEFTTNTPDDITENP